MTSNGKTGHWSRKFSEFNGGHSKQVYQGISGIHCLDYHCANKMLLYYGNDKVLSNHGHWTGYFSDEGNLEQSRRLCPDKMFVVGVHCTNNKPFCDEMRLRCTPVHTGYHSTDDTMKTIFFSTSEGYKSCAEGYYVYGIGCGGEHCYAIQLYCRKILIQQYLYPSLVYHDWPVSV